MTHEQLVRIMDRMAVATRTTVDPELVPVWWDHIGSVDVDVAADACEDWIDNDQSGWFPSVGIFQGYIASVLRRRERDQQAALHGLPAPRSDCERCHGQRWYQGGDLVRVNKATGETFRYEMWKPCESCDPIGFDAWLRYRNDRAEAKRQRPWETRDPEKVHEYLDTARNSLTTT